MSELNDRGFGGLSCHPTTRVPYAERFVDPRDIALRDRDEYFVEKILAYRGDIGRLTTLVFHVKWRGYDESFNSWEP